MPLWTFIVLNCKHHSGPFANVWSYFPSWTSGIKLHRHHTSNQLVFLHSSRSWFLLWIGPTGAPVCIERERLLACLAPMAGKPNRARGIANWGKSLQRTEREKTGGVVGIPSALRITTPAHCALLPFPVAQPYKGYVYFLRVSTLLFLMSSRLFQSPLMCVPQSGQSRTITRTIVLPSDLPMCCLSGWQPTIVREVHTLDFPTRCSVFC